MLDGTRSDKWKWSICLFDDDRKSAILGKNNAAPVPFKQCISRMPHDPVTSGMKEVF